jgi:hypothetical protein
MVNLTMFLLLVIEIALVQKMEAFSSLSIPVQIPEIGPVSLQHLDA